MASLRSRQPYLPSSALFCAIVATLALIPYLPALLTPGATFFYRDLTNVFLPAKAAWLRGVLELGRIPHWNPFLGGGIPFLADLGPGPLYPLNFGPFRRHG